MKTVRSVFMGTPHFAVPALNQLAQLTDVVQVYTQPDRPVGRGLNLSQSPVKRRALELDLTVRQPEKLTLPGEFEFLQSIRPDLIIVAAYGQILKKSVLDLPRFGCLNIHSSILPRWRGAAPIQWAILSGDTQTGVTLMNMAEKLDAGNMLLVQPTDIVDQDTAQTLHDRLAEMGGDLLKRYLEDLALHPENYPLLGITQDESQVTYAKKLTKEMEVLNPHLRTAIELDRQIRALTPWPGTSLFLEIKQSSNLPTRLKILKTQLHSSISSPVGQVTERAGMILVGTPKGSLQLEMIQLDGKKPQSITEFTNGLNGRGIQLPIQVAKEASQEPKPGENKP